MSTHTPTPVPDQGAELGPRTFAITRAGRPLQGLQPYLGADGHLYGQDDWRIGDRLTLNLGLRWDANVGKLVLSWD